MKTCCIIPVKYLNEIKSRLASILDSEQRRKLNLCMLEDVTESVKVSSLVDETVVVSPDTEVLQFARDMKINILQEKSQDGVNKAVERATKLCIDRGFDSSLILPSDIPLITPLDIDEIIGMVDSENSVVITPSIKLDGTNALLCFPPKIIRTYYDNDSFESHYREALDLKINCKLYLSRRVMLDLDSPDDIREFLVTRSNTTTYEYLKSVL